MSRFCDSAALKSRWGKEEVDRLADSAAGPGGDAAAVITQAIADAEAEALSYLLSRYDDSELPDAVGSTPAVLTNKVADLAIYELAKHQTGHVSERYVTARTDAVSWLGRVQRGQVDLGLASAPSVDSSQPQILATKTKDDMVFGNEGLDGW